MDCAKKNVSLKAHNIRSEPNFVKNGILFLSQIWKIILIWHNLRDLQKVD
jgi:hypothetical protein